MLVFADLALAYVNALLLYEIKLMGRACIVMICHDKLFMSISKARLLLFLRTVLKDLLRFLWLFGFMGSMSK
jgi:hypothetical protein